MNIYICIFLPWRRRRSSFCVCVWLALFYFFWRLCAVVYPTSLPLCDQHGVRSGEWGAQEEETTGFFSLHLIFLLLQNTPTFVLLLRSTKQPSWTRPTSSSSRLSTHTRRSSSAFDDEALPTWFILQSYKCVLERDVEQCLTLNHPAHRLLAAAAAVGKSRQWVDIISKFDYYFFKNILSNESPTLVCICLL